MPTSTMPAQPPPRPTPAMCAKRPASIRRNRKRSAAPAAAASSSRVGGADEPAPGASTRDIPLYRTGCPAALDDDCVSPGKSRLVAEHTARLGDREERLELADVPS